MRGGFFLNSHKVWNSNILAHGGMQHFLKRKIDSFLCVDPCVHQSLSMRHHNGCSPFLIVSRE